MILGEIKVSQKKAILKAYTNPVGKKLFIILDCIKVRSFYLSKDVMRRLKKEAKEMGKGIFNIHNLTRTWI